MDAQTADVLETHGTWSIPPPDNCRSHYWSDCRCSTQHVPANTIKRIGADTLTEYTSNQKVHILDAYGHFGVVVTSCGDVKTFSTSIMKLSFNRSANWEMEGRQENVSEIAPPLKWA